MQGVLRYDRINWNCVWISNPFFDGYEITKWKFMCSNYSMSWMHVCIIWKMINAIILNPIITSFIQVDVHLRLLILTKRILCNLYSHQRRARQLFFQAESNISIKCLCAPLSIYEYSYNYMTFCHQIPRQKLIIEVQLNA